MPLRKRLRLLRLGAERGFTTITIMGVLLTGGLLVTASFAAVNPDIFLTAKDGDFKQSYGAAEAGLNYYLNHLGSDNNYYVHCTNVTAPSPTEASPVNQQFFRTSAGQTDPRVWRNIPGSRAQYTIELLPTKNYVPGAGAQPNGTTTGCVENKQESMIDSSTGTIRIRATGRMGRSCGTATPGVANPEGCKSRTVVAALRRKAFIDFLYLTDFETSDPATYPSAAAQTQASNECVKYRAQRTSFCNTISFGDFDKVNGPLHTNDDIRVCPGSTGPIFGRTAADRIELNGTTPGWADTSGCSGSPVFTGTRKYPGGQLAFPPSNGELLNVVDPNYKYVGKTTIVINGSSMTVTNPNKNSGNPFSTSLPANGVIFVQSSGCGTAGYTIIQTYSASSGCGNVTVSGNYSKDLTIAADNDIIVNGDLKRSSGSDGVLLGLIANNFVRVYHPATGNNGSSCTNAAGTLTNVEIDAAILAIQHSFIVDNYYCGGALGTLTVDGAIAQRFRGPVGTLSGTTRTNGYAKNYSYNDRLRFREPPYFIDPVSAQWNIVRQTEQTPPTK